MKYKSNKEIGISGFIVLILIIIDQITKFLATINLKNNDSIVLIQDVFELKYLENQSAAFGSDIVSLLQRIVKLQYFYDNPEKFIIFKMIVFAILTITVVILLTLFYIKIPADKHYFWMNICIILFVAGAIGNLIDRIIHHYVVDFFYFSLINFPIFNVADIYVTVAAFLFIFLLLFIFKEDDLEKIFPSKKGKKK